MRAQQVVGEAVREVWLQVLPLLAESAKFSLGELVAQDLFNGILEEKMQLWIVRRETITFALVTELQQLRRKKVCVVVAVGGKDSIIIMNTFRGSFYTWLRINEVSSLRSFCRPSVSRLLQRIGFKVKCEMLEIDMEGDSE